MRVLLISANRERIPDPIFPLGLAYVAAAARRAGHTVAVADLCFGRRPLENLRRQVNDFQPDIAGVSIRNVDNAAYPLTVDYLDLHREVVDTLRNATSIPIVLGGSGFSVLPRPYMEILNGDWGIAGDGEQNFVRLLDALERGWDPGMIPGVLSRATDSNRTIAVSTTPPEIWGQGLHPARDLFDYRRYVRRGGMGNIQTKRGCVFKCSYCTYPLLEGNRFRAREPADVVDEFQELMEDYGSHPVFFVDSILNFPRGHVEGICEEILRRKLKGRWGCYATPVKLDQAQARLMARAGCDSIELGSDAADDGQLERLGKSFNTATVVRANRYCLDAGMKVCHTLIFGGPGETTTSIRNTCRNLRAMEPTAVVAMTGVRLYPDTPLTSQLIAEGRITNGEAGLRPSFYIAPAVVEFLPAFLQQQAREAGNWVLPGLAPPLLPGSQRMLRTLGISGPLWRLLQFPWMRSISRTKFQSSNTSWGVPNLRRTIL